MQLADQIGFLGAGGIDRRHQSGRRIHQRLCPLSGDAGIFQQRLGLRDRGLLGGEIRFKRPAFQPIQHVALFDLAALDEIALLDERGYPRHQVHPIGCLHPADIIGAFHNIPLGGGDHADRRRPARAKLRKSRRGGQQNGNNSGKTTHRGDLIPLTPGGGGARPHICFPPHMA